ncbi:hypothetical protein QBC32DRAFT_54343 [Pseudoneurospora amorphoporcata]|uniref:Uncharacterized protein n=1 Tax=Pseudoneurospora amorphoporcata TaxID=241081 RepID=A0AAN6SD40_9PEZI|nr:hypothetical protein QBC32DRAFT_54343 [Pseudoneurospora amorphoporcata]
MGAVVSCIQSVFRTIGRAIMGVVHGIGAVLMAIINGVIGVIDVIVGFLTCNYCGSRRGRMRRRTGGMGRTRHAHTTATI